MRGARRPVPLIEKRENHHHLEAGNDPHGHATTTAESSAVPRLLLVDDEVRWAERLAVTLARSGLDVRTCHDGLTALAAMKRWTVDVVLLDERMPGMNGFEVCRRLRSDGYCGAILIYSAYDADSDVVLAHQAGADDHVSKAAHTTVVVAKIRRAHARVLELLHRVPSPHARRPSAISDVLRSLGLPHTSTPPSLTRIEERLLCLLLSAAGDVVPVESLTHEAWGRIGLPARVLYEPMSNLREKVAELGWRIQNVRGRGYRLERWAEAQESENTSDTC